MKRRAILRVAMGLVSSGVFGASGWLMGTRALTMPTTEPPPQCPTYCTTWSVCTYVGGCLEGNPLATR